MTFQKRYLVDLQDILRIRMTCRKCHSSVSLPPNEIQYVHDSCQNCNEDWFLRDTADKNALDRLIQALVTLQKRGKETPCDIQLELEQPA